MNIKLDDFTDIKHEVHIVDENFPISSDGILGRDFFIRFKCILNFETWTLNLRVNKKLFELPISDKCETRCNVRKIVVPPRSEVIRPVKLNLSEDSVVHECEISAGVLVANSIIPSVGNQYVKLINQTDQPAEFTHLTLLHEPLNNFCRVNFISGHSDSERKALVGERVRKNLGGLPLEEFEPLTNLCQEFNDIFHLPKDTLTVNNFYEQEIIVTNPKPVCSKNYRPVEAQKADLNAHIDSWIKDDIIEPSISPWNSPIFLVPKAGEPGKTRLVVDLRKVNEQICGDAFPLPHVSEIMDQMGRAKVWAKLDLKSGFLQVPLKPGISRAITSFSCKKGHFQFKRLPYGIKVAPNSFQRMMSIALAGLEDICSVFIDDICVWAPNLRLLVRNLRRVMERLRKFNLKLNLDKCEFFKRELFFLGHHCSADGVKPDFRKFNLIRDYKEPTDPKSLLRFIAFCNYYRKFCKENFAELCRPLNELLRKGVPWEWTPERQTAFDNLKKFLSSPQVLQPPNYSKEFRVTCDASLYCLGAILSQLDEKGRDKPVEFASRTLNKHEKKKDTTIRELYAIHFALRNWRHILLGRRFSVFTDHRPLVSLFKMKHPTSQLNRIRLELMEFDFQVKYVPGKDNKADFLSRIVIDTAYLKSLIPNDDVKIDVVTRSMSKQLTKESNVQSQADSIPRSDHGRISVWDATSPAGVHSLPELRFVFKNAIDERQSKNADVRKTGKNFLVTLSTRDANELPVYLQICMQSLADKFGKLRLRLALTDEIFQTVTVQNFKKMIAAFDVPICILLYSPPVRVTDRAEQLRIIELFHNDIYGHFGLWKTVKRISQRFHWPGLQKMVSEKLSACAKCQLNKVTRHNYERMQVTDTPSSSFEVTEMDLVGPLPITETGFRYAMTFQCSLTKFIHAIPIPDKSAVTVARAIVEQFFCIFGACHKWRTDLGSEFVNEVFRKVTGLLNVQHVSATGYHHQTLGGIERSHRVLNEFLRMQDPSLRSAWDRILPLFAFAYNTTPHVSTNFTPFELVYGKLPNFVHLPGSNVSSPVYTDSYAEELKVRLREAHRMVRALLHSEKLRRCATSNEGVTPAIFRVGDLVKLRLEDRHKLDPVYSGPHKVVAIEGVNTKIEVKGKIMTVHNNRLMPYI